MPLPAASNTGFTHHVLTEPCRQTKMGIQAIKLQEKLGFSCFLLFLQQLHCAYNIEVRRGGPEGVQGLFLGCWVFFFTLFVSLKKDLAYYFYIYIYIYIIV